MRRVVQMSLAPIAFVVAATVAAAPAVAQPKPPQTDFSGLPDKLSGDEIKANWFDGRKVLAVSPDGTQFEIVFTPDGKASRTQIGAKRPRATTGFWRVIAEGYCSRWTGNNREKCFNVRKASEGNDVVVRFGQQVVATWRRP